MNIKNDSTTCEPLSEVVENAISGLFCCLVIAAIVSLAAGCTSYEIEKSADRGAFAKGGSAGAGGAYQLIRGEADTQACGIGEIGEPPAGDVTIDYKDANCGIHYEHRNQ